MARGLGALATISATAPLVGIFGAYIGINSAFKGCGCDTATLLAAIAMGLAEGIVPVAIGLFVALPAFWAQRHFRDCVDDIDVEMRNATRQLINTLTGASRS